ncbi:bifunctional protein hldE [Candidatus Blochmanniella vafra str. BVAF]|uniref:Bifunctional protein HldE n=1 Tax=Blochmanniella vafra (strain BVAF) TaxID=859654 RepID=E8Q6N3_BLOVB|nr:bifunctional D-glycero-beta-D-manno-heptose-7-phosphate kinase/D-glycero-beta-D-manno-heptose 1-phosphate adenylyltransferase HldE [Candidatus Blochmannia vafer]ADV33474.1 bifunctional protein hldE [Candidatus Blochmannia vafer str. BVAF]
MKDDNFCFVNFLKSNVLIVGDVILDRYWCGFTNKISLESSGPIVKINKIVNRPGGASNVAMNIAALGGQVRLIGLVGIDKAARILKKQLLKFKIKWNVVPLHTYSTILKLRVLSKKQQLIRLDFEKNVENIDTNQLINEVKLHLTKHKILVLSDYAKGALNKIEEIIELARLANIPVIIDPKGIQFSRYKGATILTPNMSEFESVAGFCRNDKILISRAKEIIYDYNLSALLITRAEKGMVLLRKKLIDHPLYFKAQSKVVYDVTGAGDTVVGVLSAALSYGESLEKACFLANSAAGLVIGKFGTATVDMIEMKNIIQKYEYENMPFGILDENTLKRIVSVARNRGEKIVMTNGVFDILHYGHVNYLTNARKLGDRLIVAVNSDESTKRLKGKGRPINTLKKRMVVLSALSMVDWVVPFYEDTPIRLISEISPDFLVKGGDYDILDIDGNKEVVSKGGKVCVLKFQSGFSSSKIINFIQNNRDKLNVR